MNAKDLSELIDKLTQIDDVEFLEHYRGIMQIYFTLSES